MPTWLLDSSVYINCGQAVGYRTVAYNVETRCGRHDSPPASSVNDIIFCCADSSYVSVDTGRPSLLRSSSSPKLYHLQSLSSDVDIGPIIGIVSSRVQTTSVSLSFTSLGYSLPAIFP